MGTPGVVVVERERKGVLIWSVVGGKGRLRWRFRGRAVWRGGGFMVFVAVAVVVGARLEG